MSQYKLATMEMVGAFYRFCANNFIDFKDYCAEVENPYEKVPEMDESTLKGWLVNSAVAISEELKMQEIRLQDVSWKRQKEL